MSKRYDVIILGARCAGSPTAMLLARKGYRVLVVDRSTFASALRRSPSAARPGRRSSCPEAGPRRDGAA